jgi:hypothetical protein
MEDLFDHFDEEDDDYEDIGDLDFLMSIKLGGEEEDQLFDTEDNDDDDADTHHSKEEQSLSQKLSQLSTVKKEIEIEDSAHNNKRQCSQSTLMTGPVLKKMRIKEKQILDTIPKYLLPTNKSFTQMLEQQSWFKKDPAYFHRIEEDLRYLTILLHKSTVLNLQRDLWLTYVKSGTGRLKEIEHTQLLLTNNSGPYIWPVKIKSFLLSKRITTEMNSYDEHQACLDIVYQFIQDLNVKDGEYQQELSEKRKTCIKYIDMIGKDLLTYIEQQEIYFLRLKCELKQALVNNDY